MRVATTVICALLLTTTVAPAGAAEPDEYELSPAALAVLPPEVAQAILTRQEAIRRARAGAAQAAGRPKTWRYTYDRVGNRISEQVDDDVTTSIYNERNQLVSRSAGGVVRWRGRLSEPGSVAFTSATVNGQPARMLAGNVFEADLELAPGLNQVTVEARDASGNITTQRYEVAISGSGALLTYDAVGNLEAKTEGPIAWAYQWDVENRLKRVLRSDGGAPPVEVARYAYDPLGRRIEKVAGGITTRYLYDGDNIIREVQTPTVGPPKTYNYVHGPGVDEPLARSDGQSGAATYYHADALGSIVATTDESGALASTYYYDPWGRPETLHPGGFAFTGREYDVETRLYYYRARYYDPKVGRFASEDPIGFEGGVNFYAYVLNNPVRYTDPSGLELPPSSTFGPHRPAPQLDPNANPWGGAWQAQQRNFPWDHDPHGGGYRHCVAACLVGRLTPFSGTVIKVIDWIREDPSDAASRSDMDAERKGLGCSSANNSCESECLKQYPLTPSPFF